MNTYLLDLKQLVYKLQKSKLQNRCSYDTSLAIDYLAREIDRLEYKEIMDEIFS